MSVRSSKIGPGLNQIAVYLVARANNEIVNHLGLVDGDAGFLLHLRTDGGTVHAAGVKGLGLLDQCRFQAALASAHEGGSTGNASADYDDVEILSRYDLVSGNRLGSFLPAGTTGCGRGRGFGSLCIPGIGKRGLCRFAACASGGHGGHAKAGAPN